MKQIFLSRLHSAQEHIKLKNPNAERYIELSPSKNAAEYEMMLGTPNGRGVIYLLARHTDMFPRKNIGKIMVDIKEANMFLHITN